MKSRIQLGCISLLWSAGLLATGLVAQVPDRSPAALSRGVTAPATPAPAPGAAATPATSAHAPGATAQAASAATQTPPRPPQVTYHDGLLSIQAANSTLGDVLRAVQRATGAAVESPGYASERVYVNLGPGQPRNVIATLLNGSPYDYVLVGVPQQPEAVGRVMLTMRSSSAQPGTAAGNQPVAQARPAPAPPPESDVDDAPDREAADEDAVPPGVGAQMPGQPKPGQTPAAGAQPAQPNPAGAQGAQPNNPGTPGTSQVKTPEELLKQLQQIQQKQFQFQNQLQQQNQPNSQNQQNQQQQ